MCPGLGTQETIQGGSGAGGSTGATGGTLTRTAVSRHDYGMQMEAERESHGLSAEEENARLWRDVHENERRMKVLEDEASALRNTPVAAQRR